MKKFLTYISNQIKPIDKAQQKKQKNLCAERILLYLIIFLCIILRLQWVTNINPYLFPNEIHPATIDFLGYDGVRYDWIAVNLLNGEGYGYTPNNPDAWRPPGYPFFLLTVYKIFGHSYLAVRFIQALLSGGICLLIYLLSKKILYYEKLSPFIALSASFLYAMDYYSIIMTGIFYTEIFTSFFVLLAVYLFLLARDSKKRKFFLLFSIGTLSFWYAVLTRPSNILFWGWVGPWILLDNWKHHKKRIVSSYLIIITGFLIVIMPWSIRNYQLYDKFLLISSNGGFIFQMAHHPLSEGEFVVGDLYTDKQREKSKLLDPIARDKQRYQYGMSAIKNNPQKFFRLLLEKQNLLWKKPEHKRKYFDVIDPNPLPLLTFHTIALFAFFGLLFSLVKPKSFMLPIGYIAIYCAMISVMYIYNGPRTRIELIPFLTIFAGMGIVKLLQLFFLPLDYIRSKQKTI